MPTAQRLNPLWTVLLLVAALLAGPAALAAAEPETRLVVDELGRTVRVPPVIRRVISLAPNLTEIIYALGAEDRLVGITNECDFPPAARSKTRVGDVINPSLEKIIELKPDVVLGTTAGNRRETVDILDRAGIPLYGVDTRTVEDVVGSIRHLADLLGIPEAGDALATRLETQLATLSEQLQNTDSPRILFAIWLEPLITVGNDTFLNDIIHRAGATSVTADLSQDWPRLSLEAVIERDPDYLVVPRAANLEERFSRMRTASAWGEVRAVRQSHVVWLDEAVLRPGPRIVQAIEELARALHREKLNSRTATR